MASRNVQIKLKNLYNSHLIDTLNVSVQKGMLEKVIDVVNGDVRMPNVNGSMWFGDELTRWRVNAACKSRRAVKDLIMLVMKGSSYFVCWPMPDTISVRRGIT